MNVDLKRQIEELNQTIEEARLNHLAHSKAIDEFYTQVADYFLFWAQIAIQARSSYDQAYKDMVLENIAKSLYDTAQDFRKKTGLPEGTESDNLLVREPALWR